MSVFKKLTELNYVGILETNGFVSMPVNVFGFTTISISLHTEIELTFSLYSYNDISDLNGTGKRRLIFQKVIPIGIFNEKIDIKFNLIGIVLTNPVAGKIVLQTALLTNNQYSSQTFINSPLSKTSNANTIINANDFQVDLVRGLYEDFKKNNVLGINDNSNNGSNIYTLGTNITSPPAFNRVFIPPLTAQAVSISVDNVNDNNVNNDNTNSGARTLRMIYIDENEERQQVDIWSGNGVVGVSCFSVERLYLLTAGGDNVNMGNIFITDSNSNVYAQIMPEYGTSSNAIYRVPINRVAIMKELNLSGYSNGDMVIIYLFRGSLKNVIGKFLVNTTGNQLIYNLDGLLTAGEVIVVNVLPSDVSGSSTLINVNVNVFECPVKNTF